MRLIDADDVKKEIDDWLDVVGDVVIGKHLSYYGELLGCIEDAPTVEAVPVVRGEWKIGSKPRCSACGKPALREYDRDDWLSYVPSNFCPNCGADMRKKVERWED